MIMPRGAPWEHESSDDVLHEADPLEAHHRRAPPRVSLNYSEGDHTSASLQMKK